MFFRHYHEHDRCNHGGHARGRFGWRERGGGFGGREGRMFDGGELRLVILALVAEKPRYGYEVIKALGERVGGDYSPSPGVVYPTLTMLHEMAQIEEAASGGARKAFAITPEGEAFLAANKAQVDAILERLDGANENRFAGAGSVIRAMLNLRATTRLRLRTRGATPEQIQAITDALDAAAKAIEKI